MYEGLCAYISIKRMSEKTENFRVIGDVHQDFALSPYVFSAGLMNELMKQQYSLMRNIVMHHGA